MLHQYHIDFSQLSPDEKAALSDRIDNISFTGIQWEQGFNLALSSLRRILTLGF